MDEPMDIPAEQADHEGDSGDPLRRTITQAIAQDAGEGMLPGGWVLLYTVVDDQGEDILRLYGSLEDQNWRHRDEPREDEEE